MEIRLIQRRGVPQAEIGVLKQIQEEFDNTPFSKSWRGYASFALARGGRGTGDDDFDLVIVTHTHIVVIELKNWHGKVLESDGHKWFLDGEDRGSSPVGVVNLKAKKLANIMKQKLGVERTPFVASYVVMHGQIGEMKLTKEEESSVLNKTELLSMRFENCYRDYFRSNPRFNPLNYMKDYEVFFEGPSFKPKVYYVDGFCPEADAIFIHPKKLYSEFRALAKDDPNTQALFRQWNFNALGLDFISEADRSSIGLREQRVFQYVADRNEELSLSLLRPLSRKGAKDVTLDFAELFALPRKIERLSEFIHSVLPTLSSNERVVLVKVMISRFADLHDLRVAHRDIGDHSIWIDRPTKVVMSGFPAAYFPEMNTIGTFREKVKVEQSRVPEDTTLDKAATPYRRDVFMLGVLAYLIFYGEKPPIVSDSLDWSARSDDPYKGTLNAFLKRAMKHAPASRFENARQMLEAFNAATTIEEQSIIDFSAFDAFKSETKERDYEETQILKDENEQRCYRSDTPEMSRAIKVWYAAGPDPDKPDLSIRLLSFLERARAIKGCRIPGVPKIMDFGLSRRSLLLVLEWVEGRTLHEWLDGSNSIEQRLILARSVTDTIIRMHALDLPHGDIHPGNIIVKADGSAVFIDALDFHPNTNDVYTTAYLPDNYKSLSPFERDRYSLAAVLVEVLCSSRERPSQGELPIPRVYEELENLLSEQTLSTLDPLRNVLINAGKKEEEAVPGFTVAVKNLASSNVLPGDIRSDNGVFHVYVQKDKNVDRGLLFRVTGISRQISFVWKFGEDRADRVRVERIPQSQLLRSQNMRDAAIKMSISLMDGPNADVRELALHLLDNEMIQRKIPANFADQKKEATDVSPSPIEKSSAESTHQSGIPIPELWQALLDAEEESFCTITVAGEKRSSSDRDNQILVPYNIDFGVIDYETSDKVIIESQTYEGNWKSCGELNLRDTTFGQQAELAIDQPHAKANLRIGSKLRLFSTLEKGSFTRRRDAVERILQEKAVIPNLIDYFDPSEGVRLIPTTYPIPIDADLEAYSEGEIKLNDSQKEAFKRVISNGPIGLLQGPPGTGKTWFIACLLHYLMTKERARRILLVSQAHEAVNFALEKGLELCRSKGVNFDAVRLGNESAASDVIRHLHSASIEQNYRERFKAEEKERIVHLATTFGLPKQFSEEIVALHMQLGMLSDRILLLEERTETEDERTIASRDARIRALSETFFSIARDVYDFSEAVLPSIAVEQIQRTLIERFEVRSNEAVERLRKLLRLSEEWLGALGSPDANFSEFLAKSRTIVAGTLVGIGHRGAGVVNNVYDWVIIDEAGRAAPSELAVAMQAGRRILLVGDHRQLPPMFSEEVRDIFKKKYGAESDSPLFCSDFERIFDSEYGRQVGASLLSQYRMGPDIGDLVSTCFYDGRLQTGRGVPPKYYDLLPEHLSKQVTWLDISSMGDSGIEQSSEDGKDKWNHSEARVVMCLLRQIVESEDFMAFLGEDMQPQEPAIGIICMYGKQRELLQKMRAEATWLGGARSLVKIDTVDSYQGKENRIIILSTVRNNHKFVPGFLRSPNRINVAMSRAMDRLYIVGASKMWKGRNAGMPLGKVLTKVESMAAEQRAAILSAEQFMEA